MKAVLLTGATGFVGRHCITPLIERGFTVHAVSSREAVASQPGVHDHRCDLLDADQTGRLLERIRPTHLLHLGWYAVHGAFWASSENLMWLQASLALATAFQQHGGHRIVVAGSCAEYDARFGFCTEGVTPLAPATLYGATKHALHVALTPHAEQSKLSLAWGRMFFMYGPHEQPSRLVASVIRSALTGDEIRCTTGMQMRDLQHVKDAAGALVALLDCAVTGPVNIGTGIPTRVKDLVQRIADRLDAGSRIRLGAVPLPPNDPPLLLADVRRLRNEVGWIDRFDLESGIEDAIAWWRPRTP